MKIRIRLAKKTDLADYTKLLQETYQKTYTNQEIGLSSDCFSEQIFNTPDTQKYLASNLQINQKQKTWLAFVGSKLVGSITVVEWEKDYEMRGFYVATEYQNKGIGKKLWKLVLELQKNKDITCDLYAHNKKTVEMYKRWGFKIDFERGELYRHWPEWPEGLKAKCIYMRYKVIK